MSYGYTGSFECGLCGGYSPNNNLRTNDIGFPLCEKCMIKNATRVLRKGFNSEMEAFIYMGKETFTPDKFKFNGCSWYVTPEGAKGHYGGVVLYQCGMESEHQLYTRDGIEVFLHEYFTSFMDRCGELYYCNHHDSVLRSTLYYWWLRGKSGTYDGTGRAIEYDEYMLSGAWKRRAKHCKEMAEYSCQKCNKHMKKGLQAHHLTYARLGNELPEDLIAVCPECHSKLHNKPVRN